MVRIKVYLVRAKMLFNCQWKLLRTGMTTCRLPSIVHRLAATRQGFWRSKICSGGTIRIVVMVAAVNILGLLVGAGSGFFGNMSCLVGCIIQIETWACCQRRVIKICHGRLRTAGSVVLPECEAGRLVIAGSKVRRIRWVVHVVVGVVQRRNQIVGRELGRRTRRVKLGVRQRVRRGWCQRCRRWFRRWRRQFRFDFVEDLREIRARMVGIVEPVVEVHRIVHHHIVDERQRRWHRIRAGGIGTVLIDEEWSGFQTRWIGTGIVVANRASGTWKWSGVYHCFVSAESVLLERQLLPYVKQAELMANSWWKCIINRWWCCRDSRFFFSRCAFVWSDCRTVLIRRASVRTII